MSDRKDTQAVFMEAMNSLKEYAKVNGNIVTKTDVESYFKDMDLDNGKYQMIAGYLMANNIKIEGELSVDNQFLDMMESAVEHDKMVENGEEITEEVQEIVDTLDYSQDDQYIELYKKDLEKIEALSDVTRSYLLINIVEDNDKESLKLLSESFLHKILEWVEPFKKKGVLAGDLIQEGSLAMMSYISEKKWLNNYEWKDKIKEGTTNDLLEVMKGIDEEVKSEVEGCIRMLIDEQTESAKVAGKVLNKVNLVNDWAKRLRADMGRKPTVDEVAEKMGLSRDNVLEAIELSAENIEDISMEKDNSLGSGIEIRTK